MMKISAGLERAFAGQGFAEPSVEVLRDEAGVSLRTLYKYAPSRDDMVLAALEYRHGRYVGHVFEALPDCPEDALGAILERVGSWMATEASHGCLFHAAVAAAPGNARLRELLERHKGEVADRAVRATGLQGREVDLSLIIEGLTQSWTLHGLDAVASARRLSRSLQPVV